MVSKKYIEEQLETLGFNGRGWGRAEVNELHNVLLPDEEIHELVNGIYEGGFALLLATDVRLLLVDKKPMNYLNVEDLRFDMINEMDYTHRLIGAQISVATGNKNLRFTALNQPRLRKLIGHVQHSMAEYKKQITSHQEDQRTHLEQINQQLQAYLVAQHQYQLQLQQAQRARAAGKPAALPAEPAKPSAELSDFLYSQSLLAQYQAQTGATDLPLQLNPVQDIVPQLPAAVDTAAPQDELLAEGQREVFGGRLAGVAESPSSEMVHQLEINPIRIAYSKLPMALRNRRFGRPSFHAHSAKPALPPARTAEI